ncbi:CDP-alcohol phosphatidyltransferase family protein [Leucobacter sp. HY1908]
MYETRRPGYAENLRRLAWAQKSSAGVPGYTRWVNRAAGRRIAAAAAVLGLTPNAVTAVSAALSLAGLAVIVVFGPTLAAGVGAAVLLALGFAFDSADGQLARLTRRGGPAGEWLDHVVDATRTPLTHVAVAVAAYLHLPGSRWLSGVALAYAVIASAQFTSQILAEQLVIQSTLARGAADVGGAVAGAPAVPGVVPAAAHTRGSAAGQGAAGPAAGHAAGPQNVKSLGLLPLDTGTLCWSFVLWGLPALFAPAYAALFAINAVYAAVSMKRKYNRLRSLA